MTQRPCPAPRSGTRRRWLIACALGAPAAAWPSGTQPDAAAFDAWLDLSEPVATRAGDVAQRARVAAQQDAIAARLQELGIVELSRVRHARNAILVRVTPAQAELVRTIPGVARVRAARTVHPPKPMP